MPAPSSCPTPTQDSGPLVLPSGLGCGDPQAGRWGQVESYLVQGRNPGRDVGLGFRSPPHGLQTLGSRSSRSPKVSPTAGPKPGWHLNPPAVPPGGDRDCRVTSGKTRKSRLALWVFAPIPEGSTSLSAPGLSEPGKRTSVGGSLPLVRNNGNGRKGLDML